MRKKKLTQQSRKELGKGLPERDGYQKDLSRLVSKAKKNRVYELRLRSLFLKFKRVS